MVLLPGWNAAEVQHALLNGLHLAMLLIGCFGDVLASCQAAAVLLC